MARDQLVEVVERRIRDRPENPRHRTRESQRTREVHGASSVADRRVADDEAPCRVPLLLRHAPEERRGGRVAQRKDQELTVAVEQRDRPRREAAEPTAAVVEKDGPSWIRHVSIVGQGLQTAPTL